MTKRDTLNRILNRKSPTNDSETNTTMDQENEFQRANNFTFRDIESSMDKFNGDVNVTQWIDEFEETANWNDLEKLVYARRLLVYIPKRYVNSELKPKAWSELKAKLIKEFKRDVNSGLIHKKLASSKKISNETLNQYVYRMSEIAAPIQLDVKALIMYIVDGIEDSKTNKLFLYQATTMSELKEKLQLCMSSKN